MQVSGLVPFFSKKKKSVRKLVVWQDLDTHYE